MRITQFNEQEALSLCADSVERVVQELADFLKITTDEVVIYFVSKEAITELHGDHFDDPTPTDCITFPFDPNGVVTGGSLLGEVFICPRVALEYTEESGGDPYRETTLYLIHTLLHILGYNDLEQSERDLMRQKEQECLAHLSKKSIFLSD